MIQIGQSLSDELGTDVTFASSSGPSGLGPVLAATGFNAVQQDVPEVETKGADIAGLVRTKGRTPSMDL